MYNLIQNSSCAFYYSDATVASFVNDKSYITRNVIVKSIACNVM